MSNEIRTQRAHIQGQGGAFDRMRHLMDKIAKPTPEELRKAQAALNALNEAYAYFEPLPTPTETTASEYFEYVKAA